MEAKHQGSIRGFVRGKQLVKSLFRVTKPSKPVQSCSKVSPSRPCTHVDFPTRQSYYANPPSFQKVSTTKLRSFPDSGGDENVDMKAATYISYVRERFKLERADFEAL
ncbi:hypothetical protein NC652_009471 [Populus alba x Populus x berolinensis]|uniref:Uncharacterized protein n=3 Tax=Populus TaxID=3689 RepID=A0A4U5QHT9_POPAL|nr:hypothetical protein NC651_009248 [Populus alba x Populus x berolinensis]KAJ6944053.1 hypothetical protein NC652_009471 [Populus alba x Populus x berolinensis]KAJ7004633.1 hypothetical protein NC653_009467 [Populus alba x Populus x berolinensis]TKS08647.1 hypothetical protein D5086_0000099460 [Populus alba]